MVLNATQLKALSKTSLSGQDRTVVVTGATYGIGAAVARQFAKIGCERIIILGRNEERAQKVLQDLKDLAPEGTKVDAHFVKGDLS
jgi:NAD(P)-dependent dehydrogenase (short-subunit alcohol dehydrogenase family)